VTQRKVVALTRANSIYDGGTELTEKNHGKRCEKNLRENNGEGEDRTEHDSGRCTGAYLSGSMIHDMVEGTQLAANGVGCRYGDNHYTLY
jgi:hypothetical protein